MKPTPIIAALVALAGCKKTVDHQEFETTVVEQVKALGLTPGAVSCPSDIEGKAGTTFICAVPIEKWSYDLKVTITSVENNRALMDTAWVRGPSVLRSKLEASAKKTYEGVDVHCGEEPMIFLVDGKTSCTLSSGKTTTTMTLTYSDKLDVDNTKLDPPVLNRAKLEQLLEPAVGEKLKAPVKVSCGPDVILLRPADGFVWCEVTAGDKQAKLRVTVTPDLDVTAWDIPSS